jgi:hypothetical protein
MGHAHNANAENNNNNKNNQSLTLYEFLSTSNGSSNDIRRATINKQYFRRSSWTTTRVTTVKWRSTVALLFWVLVLLRFLLLLFEQLACKFRNSRAGFIRWQTNVGCYAQKVWFVVQRVDDLASIDHVDPV